MPYKLFARSPLVACNFCLKEHKMVIKVGPLNFLSEVEIGYFPKRKVHML